MSDGERLAVHPEVRGGGRHSFMEEGTCEPFDGWRGVGQGKKAERFCQRRMNEPVSTTGRGHGVWVSPMRSVVLECKGSDRLGGRRA